MLHICEVDFTHPLLNKTHCVLPALAGALAVWQRQRGGPHGGLPVLPQGMHNNVLLIHNDVVMYCTLLSISLLVGCKPVLPQGMHLS